MGPHKLVFRRLYEGGLSSGLTVDQAPGAAASRSGAGTGPGRQTRERGGSVRLRPAGRSSGTAFAGRGGGSSQVVWERAGLRVRAAHERDEVAAQPLDSEGRAGGPGVAH